MEESEFPRRWRASLVRFDEAQLEALGLDRRALDLLCRVGLPSALWPRWNFTGEAVLWPDSSRDFVQIGKHCLAPLVMSAKTGAVHVAAGEGKPPAYCNRSLEAFVRCLVLAFGRRPEVATELSLDPWAAELRRRFLEIDESCLAPGTLWCDLVEEWVEEEAEIREAQGGSAEL